MNKKTNQNPNRENHHQYKQLKQINKNATEQTINSIINKQINVNIEHKQTKENKQS